MAVTVTESQNSPTAWGATRGELRYLIRGTDDENTAITALLATAPSSKDGLVRDWKGLSVGPHPSGNAEAWVGTVPYKSEESSPQAGDVVYQFQTSGGTEHITHSLAQVAKYAASGTAPDSKQLIGDTGDAVEGMDIETKAYDWSETRYFDKDEVTAAYVAKLYALSKCVNVASFTDGKGCSYPAGAVLFHGAVGSVRADGTAEITYSFSAKPNVTGLTIGDITGITHKGWEILDVRYKPTVAGSGAAKRLLRIPHIVYVHKGFEDGDFDDLFPS